MINRLEKFRGSHGRQYCFFSYFLKSNLHINHFLNKAVLIIKIVHMFF